MASSSKLSARTRGGFFPNALGFCGFVRGKTFPIPADPGTYALLLHSTSTPRVRIGRLGAFHVRPGFYVYIGSAFGPGGLRARIAHHERIARRPHWHIDYLRTRVRLEAVWYICGDRCEHEWAARIAALPGVAVPIARFGASDCRCAAHLVWIGERVPISIALVLGAQDMYSAAPQNRKRHEPPRPETLAPNGCQFG